jgi:excisionase family DNA binding protein
MSRHFTTSELEILCVRDICDLLRVSHSTVYKLARQGAIPSFRIGASWRFRKDAIVKWMAEQSVDMSGREEHGGAFGAFDGEVALKTRRL